MFVSVCSCVGKRLVKLTGTVEQEHLAVEGGTGCNGLGSLEGGGTGSSWQDGLKASASTSATLGDCSDRCRCSHSSSLSCKGGFCALLLGSVNTSGDSESHEGKVGEQHVDEEGLEE